ncbi:MAG TPA: hypothetical protein PLV58_04255 [Campylobacterales bacterium]|nr:hypothetical protein [Campylobacterales bacterium]
MRPDKADSLLFSIVEILKHIQSVQGDVMELSERSAVRFHDFITENKLTPNEDVLQAFQYQDIVSQQLNAVSEAIVAVEKNIAVYLHAVKQDQNTLAESIEKLSAKLTKSLKMAQEKQEAFSGNAIDNTRGKSIEFF